MAAVAFNTLKFTRRLRAVGIRAAQAEAFADALSEDAMIEVATKRDLGETEERVTGTIHALETTTKRDLATLEERLNAGIASVSVNLAATEERLETKIVSAENRIATSLAR